jgi:hypothetical protein
MVESRTVAQTVATALGKPVDDWLMFYELVRLVLFTS